MRCRDRRGRRADRRQLRRLRRARCSRSARCSPPERSSPASTPLYDLDDGNVIRARPVSRWTSRGRRRRSRHAAGDLPGRARIGGCRSPRRSSSSTATRRPARDGARRMDSLTALAFARELIDIDSTTGREGEAGRWLASRLRALGYKVAEQPVDGERFNVFAHARSRRTSCCRRTTTRASVHSQPRRWRALRAWCVRRQGHPRGAGGGRRASACGG